MFGDSVACLASKNVFQPRLRASFIAQPDEIGLGVVDSPADKCIDMNGCLISGVNGNRSAIQFDKSFIYPVDLLIGVKLQVTARIPDSISSISATLFNT